MLERNAHVIGKVLCPHDTLDSTNEAARRLMSKSEPADGTVIWAADQAAGRGQFDNQWYSTRGESALFSVILRPKALAVADQFVLTLMVTLSVMDGIEAICGPLDRLEVKWPNDLYLDGHKIAGVLIENQCMGQRIASTIAGVGINVRQDEMPLHLSRATSLRTITGRAIDPPDVMTSILRSLDERYVEFNDSVHRPHRREELRRGWHAAFERRMLGHGCDLMFRWGIATFPARVCGVSRSGQLHLRRDDEDLFFHLKEVEWLLD